MYKLKAIYLVVTPLFAGGADQKKVAELRAPAFKGVLRFWYRAIALSFYQGNWQQVMDKEKKLFGSTKGQASFMLKMGIVDPPGEQVPVGTIWKPQGSAYLGYGVIGWNKDSKQVETSRPYIQKGFRFSVTLVMPESKAVRENIEPLIKALLALGLFGGMGSRSRKGFGSVAVESLMENDCEIWSAPRDSGELKGKLRDLLGGMTLQSEEPEYSAFSRQSRIAVIPSNSDPLELLDEIGREMVRYRSYGRGGERKVLGNESAEQNFADDHDLVWNFVQGNQPNSNPRRVVFGLPHNYFFSTGQKVDVNANNSQRRASPLFIHMHQLSDGCAAVLTFLPAMFLPPGDSIAMAISRGNRVPIDPKIDYQVIHDFIDRFPNRLEVLANER